MTDLICLKSTNPTDILPLLAQALGQPQQALEVLSAYRQGAGQLWGSFQQGQLIALVGFQQKGVRLRLQHLAVASAWQKKGLGRNLLQQLALQTSALQMDAETDINSLGFYRALGWASLNLAPDKPGRYLCSWLSRRLLQADCELPLPPLEPFLLPAKPQQPQQVLRLDLLHPLLQGNKWLKLKPHLLKALAAGKTKLLTFGGAWSNHLFATAAAGKLLGFETLGVVRGEPTAPLNPVLTFASDCGMQLEYWSRSQYRQKSEAEVLNALQQRFPDAYIVPEGGAGGDLQLTGGRLQAALPHAAQIAVACGTGSTLAALLATAQTGQRFLGVSVLKGGDFLREAIAASLPQQGFKLADWELETRFHCGGYARMSPELTDFMQAFAELNPSLPLDRIYTAKLMFALNQLAGEPEHQANPGQLQASPLIAVHTGGIYPWNQLQTAAAARFS